MDKKPTYEELEQRVLELENLVSELGRGISVAGMHAGPSLLAPDTIGYRQTEMQYQRQTTLLRTMERVAGIGGWEVDVEEQSMFWTDEMYRIHDLDPDTVRLRETEESKSTHGTLLSMDEVIQLSLSCYHPGDRSTVLKLYEQCIEEGQPFSCEFAFNTAKGNHKWVRTTAFPVKEDGKIVKVIGVFFDITERRLTEEALRESEFFLQKSQTLAQIGSYYLDTRTGEWISSPGLDNIFGIDHNFTRNVEGWMSLIHPDYADHMSAYLNNQVLQEKKRFDKEYRILRHDSGEARWVHGQGELEFNEHGCPVKMIGTIQDITGRKEAEKSLRESEERFKALHNASFGGITIHDGGVIIECNKGLSDITGYDYDELIGMDGLLLISEDTRDTVYSNIIQGYEKPYEVKGVKKNGEIFPLRLEARNIPYRGKSVRVVEFRDLTETKEVEREREELERKLILSQKMEAVGRLAGGIAHDFNNMLGVIIGYADLAMRKTDPDEKIYPFMAEIKKAGERSADLTGQLLAFARKQTTSPKVLDLNETVSGMTRMLTRLIGEDVDLVWALGKNVWPVKMDPSQFDQILANLCVNARDAIEDVGRITIETANVDLDRNFCRIHTSCSPGEYALVSVSDNGSGMDHKTLEYIFEPFFTTKPSGKGTGLGLSTVYGVVKQNNGYINVYSEPGHGTTFKIYLPRHESPACHEEKGENHSIKQGTETILLVEDEPSILNMTVMMLEELGYRVMPAGTVAEAIRASQKHAGTIDLVLTDVIMPEMNGRDLIKTVAFSNPRAKHLYMSGYTANVIAHHGVLDEGINFISKPFSRDSLGTKLREVLDDE